MILSLQQRLFLYSILMFWMTFVDCEKASAGNIQATVDRKQVSVTEEITLVLVIQGNLDEEPQLPRVPGLMITKVGSSTRMSITFGAVSRELELSYQIVADKAGKYELPPISAKVDGKTEQSTPVALEFVDGPSSQPSGRGNFPGTSPDPNAGEQSSAALTIQRTLMNEKSSYYVGEAIVVRTEISSPSPILDFGVAEAPQYQGVRRIANDEDLKVQQTQINGEMRFVIRWVEVLIPLKPGKLTLPRAGYAAVVRAPPRARSRGSLFEDFFGDFGNSGGQRRNIRVAPQEIQIVALPATAADIPFSGLVGKFNLDFDELQNGKAKAGDAVTLLFNVSGAGVLDHWKPSALALDPSIKQYPSQPSGNSSLDWDKGIWQQRNLKVTIIPTREGTFDLPGIAVKIFNPEKSAYEILRPQTVKLEVSGQSVNVATNPTQASASSPPQGGDESNDAAQKNNKDSAVGSQSMRSEASNPWLIASVSIVVCLLLAAFSWILVKRYRILHQQDDLELASKNKLDPETLDAESTIENSKKTTEVIYTVDEHTLNIELKRITSAWEPWPASKCRQEVLTVLQKSIRGEDSHNLTSQEISRILRKKSYVHSDALDNLLRELDASAFGSSVEIDKSKYINWINHV